MTLDPDWMLPNWPSPPRVRAFVTTRAGGFSTGPYASLNLGLRTGDEADTIAKNRTRLRSILPNEPKWLHQVHGNTVVDADSVTLDPPQADASVTRSAGTVCAVLVADCIPVFFSSRTGSVVAIAHAGWRGLARGVIERTVAATGEPPGELMAFLGPGIGPLAFEVGADVRNAFLSDQPDDAAAFASRGPGKWLADLFMLARARLQRAGLTEIFGGGSCTYSNPDRFYSYRRNPTTGRMAALIWRE